VYRSRYKRKRLFWFLVTGRAQPMHEKCKSLFCFLTCDPYVFFSSWIVGILLLLPYIIVVLFRHTFSEFISQHHIYNWVWTLVWKRENNQIKCVWEREKWCLSKFLSNNWSVWEQGLGWPDLDVRAGGDHVHNAKALDRCSI